MRLLVHEWNSYLRHDIYEILREQGIAYDVFPWRFPDKNRDEAFEQWFEENVGHAAYDALLSVNFWPMLSKVCQRKGLRYLAWCYDCPLDVEHLEESLGNPVNRVFFFDRKQYEKYRDAGFDTVYHLPLGVSRTRMERLSISGRERAQYQAEVSFVGNLYESPIQAILAPLKEHTKGYLDALMAAQAKVYGYYMLDELLTDDLLADINGQYPARHPDAEFCLSREALSFAMASEITRRDRLALLHLCGRRFVTKFYCYQKTDFPEDAGVLWCGGVDYVSQMPQVFACSKVNLNPSLRIIKSGIPLRAFDIMGAGGFLLSNYQEELLEYYEDGGEMAVYGSLEEAIDKAGFYLRNESLRVKIAKRGQEKTLREHSLQGRWQELLSMADL